MANRAVLVGINNYRTSPLKGCVNDVILLEQELTTLGFEIIKLLDDQGTKQNILDGLEWLVANSRPNDIAVFHFSGHGAQIVDIHKDESDGYDEILCPIDVFSGNHVLDDDLSDYLDRVRKGVVFELILDCCHSGTGDRGDINIGDDGLQVHDPKGRFIDVSETLISHRSVGQKLGTKHAKKNDNNIVLWAACRDYETAADAYLDNAYNGAFTVNLITVWKGSKFLNRRHVIQQLGQSMRVYGFTQVPQLECSLLDSQIPFLMNPVTARNLGLNTRIPIKKVIGAWIRHMLDKFNF